MLNNLKRWFKLNCEIIFFYNVYGDRQIKSGKMATIIGIFEDCYKKNKPLPVVKPGTQTRRFTHIIDTVEACLMAFKKINLDFIQSLTNKSFPYYKLQRCLGSL